MDDAGDTAHSEVSPFPRAVSWVVVFRNPAQTDPDVWRTYSVRGTHHGASLEKSEGQGNHPDWEFRIAKRTEEWAFDDGPTGPRRDGVAAARAEAAQQGHERNEPRCPEPGCRNRAMKAIKGEYCRDHCGIERSIERLGSKHIDRLGRTLKGTP